jgi:lipid II:glycine glycyltransferase (peptidoglycan interpeptide bridge formation enzyme)
MGTGTTLADQVLEIDPLHDDRWPQFLQSHKSASVFHTREWLDALRRTYDYSIEAVTTSRRDDELANAVVFSRVRSSLTGTRLVSLPFSDHCTPLVETSEELSQLLSKVKDRMLGKGEYFELRPSTTSPCEEWLVNCAHFCYHTLDLRPDLSELFFRLHPDCVRRKIRSAERAGLRYEEGRSDALLEKFYGLTVLTRKRQGLPPQPLKWFRNLVVSMGDKLKIRLASHGATPAAAILTLQYKDTIVYKYGCSDTRFHRLGTIQMLLWMAIQAAKNDGLLKFDFGRSEWSNQGLILFKDRWGALRSNLQYWCYPGPQMGYSLKKVAVSVASQVWRRAPRTFLVVSGRILYRHMA